MDNKLWEGHRMLLPELREKIMENKKEKITAPQLSEDTLALIEERIKFALHFQKPLLITYIRNNKVNECMSFSFRLLPGVLECIFEQGNKLRVTYKEIVNIEII